MADTFEQFFVVGWEHLDSNGHMKNTAYLDLCVNTRMAFFQAHGFSPREWLRLQVGPVVMRDELEYRREFLLLDKVRVTLALAASSQDSSRFTLCNEFWRADGSFAARVTLTGGWLDLSARKLIVPPDALKRAMNELTRTTEYKVLPSSVE